MAINERELYPANSPVIDRLLHDMATQEIVRVGKSKTQTNMGRRERERGTKLVNPRINIDFTTKFHFFPKSMS